MKSNVRLFGHPVHSMLIVVPLGLFTGTIIFDLLFFATANPVWASTAFWTLAVGLIGGIIAAPFGTLDWLAIPRGTRAKYVGFLHGVGNVIALALFALSWMTRLENPVAAPSAAYLLSFAGMACSILAGWMGGELVTRLGVGVDPDAHVDAPPARESEEPPRKGIAA